MRIVHCLLGFCYGLLIHRVVRSLSDLTDLNFPLTALNSTLFPGIPSTVEAHSGFLAEHAKTAPAILAQVKSLLSSTGAQNVFLVSGIMIALSLS